MGRGCGESGSPELRLAPDDRASCVEDSALGNCSVSTEEFE